MKINKNMLWVVAGIALMMIVHVLPLPEPIAQGERVIELTAEAKTCIGLLCFAILLWITEAIPFPVTALLIMLLLPVFKIGGFKEIVQLGFGNTIVVFIIGVLLLSSAFNRSGLGRRLSYLMLSKIGIKTNRVILGFLCVGTMLSMWLSDMAVAAMLLPLALGILKAVDAQPLRSNFGKALMIACCWGPAFGGIATPAGAGPNPIVIEFLRDLVGVELTFVSWMALGVPAALLMIPIGWLVLLKMFPLEIKELSMTVEDIEKNMADLGPITARERNTLFIFFLTATLWVTAPYIKKMTCGVVDLSIAEVALFSGILMFLPKINVLSWKEAQSDVDWGGLILVMGGLALGMMVYKTGAARYLSFLFLGNIGNLSPVIRIFIIALFVGLIKVIFSSNTITGVIVIPLLIGLSSDFGLNPWLIVAPAAFTVSLSLIMVTSTPTNVIPYSAGYFSIKDMAISGLVMTVIAAGCVTVSIILMGRLTGLYQF